ncbi:MAG: 2TM domain-containing protein [Arenibacter sp.]|uniref:2TM domain-containing protein n=1 Tax=Arenibacter TaxID=178469 RepID=UPI000A397A9B|nr:MULTISPECIES: 2TM domain-containing protein [Arenibacter]MDX1328978.1 2TM domain-containing protein [Arenibacter sp.]
MFAKSKITPKIDLEQHQLLEAAQARIKQKKRLFSHFMVFLVGSIFIFLINKILGYGIEYNWYIWAIVFWAFLFVLHFVNVYVTTKFMSPEWERAQRERLVLKQKQKIAELQKEIETDFPLSNINKKLE